jgi:hypothetical protein
MDFPGSPIFGRMDVVNTKCDGAGMCMGDVDPCLDKSGEPKVCDEKVCHMSSGCDGGLCVYSLEDDGMPCQEAEHEMPGSGQCFSGVCIGAPDLCKMINDQGGCPAINECHEAAQCQDGMCPAGQPKEDGAACSDGPGDFCQAGFCTGVPEVPDEDDDKGSDDDDDYGAYGSDGTVVPSGSSGLTRPAGKKVSASPAATVKASWSVLLGSLVAMLALTQRF